MDTSTAHWPNAANFGRRPHRGMFNGLIALATRIVLWPVRVIEARRALSQLAGLTDYELRDIGLTRQDLADVTARPLDEDPTPHLTRARVSRARRAA